MERTHEQEKWEISKHATPEYAPQYGVYIEGERNDFCIVTGEDAFAKAQLIAATPDLLKACEAWITYLDSNLSEAEKVLLKQTRQAVAKVTEGD